MSGYRYIGFIKVLDIYIITIPIVRMFAQNRVLHNPHKHDQKVLWIGCVLCISNNVFCPI